MGAGKGYHLVGFFIESHLTITNTPKEFYSKKLILNKVFSECRNGRKSHSQLSPTQVAVATHLKSGSLSVLVRTLQNSLTMVEVIIL